MALSEDTKNEIKTKVLLEIENMFTSMSYKYNTKENHEMMNYLLDIESKVKQALLDVEESEATMAAT